MSAIESLNIKLSEKTDQEKKLNNLIYQINEKIKNYALLEDQNKQKNEESARAKIFEIMGNKYYWEHLKIADLIDKKDENALIEIQKKRDDYQNALDDDAESIKKLSLLSNEEAINRLKLRLFSTKKSQIAIDDLENEFIELKKLYESENIKLACLINQEINELLIIAEQYQNIFRFYKSNKTRIYFNANSEIPDKKEFKTQLNLKKLQVMDIILRKLNEQTCTMKELEKFGHTDKLHYFTEKMHQQYPEAAIVPNFNIQNLMVAEDIRDNYNNFAKIHSQNGLLVNNYQKTQMLSLEKEFRDIPWLNWMSPKLKEKKQAFALEIKEIAELVTNPYIINGLNRSSRIVKELNKSNKEREIIRIFKIELKNEKNNNQNTGQFLAKPSAFLEAFILNSLALKEHSKLTETMGWTFNIIEWIFSTKKFKSYEAVKKALVEQKQELNYYSVAYLTQDISQEVEKIFASRNKLDEIINYFLEITNRCDFLKNDSDINLDPEIQKWIKLYRIDIIKNLIGFMINKGFASEGKNFAPLAAFGFIEVNDFERIKELIKFVNVQESISEEGSQIINSYLQSFGFNQTVKELQIKKAKLQFTKYCQSKNFKGRVFEEKNILFLSSVANLELREWIIQNITICNEINIKELKNDALGDFSKLIKLTQNCIKFYPCLFSKYSDLLIKVNTIVNKIEQQSSIASSQLNCDQIIFKKSNNTQSIIEFKKKIKDIDFDNFIFLFSAFFEKLSVNNELCEISIVKQVKNCFSEVTKSQSINQLIQPMLDKIKLAFNNLIIIIEPLRQNDHTAEKVVTFENEIRTNLKEIIEIIGKSEYKNISINKNI